jgi:hypothetical protein
MSVAALADNSEEYGTGLGCDVALAPLYGSRTAATRHALLLLTAL